MLRRLWRYLIAGSPECEGSAWATKQLLLKAAAEIESGSGELKRARVIQKRAHPKVQIGAFHAKVLRMRARG